MIAAVAIRSSAGDGGDDTVVGIHFADPVGIGDEEVPGGVHRDAPRADQLGGGGWKAVAAVVRDSGAGDSGDDAGGEIHLADPVASLFCDEKVASRVHCERSGVVQFGGGGRTVITRIPAASRSASDGGNDAGGEIHFADPVVIGDKEVPGCIHRKPVARVSRLRSAAVARRPSPL